MCRTRLQITEVEIPARRINPAVIVHEYDDGSSGLRFDHDEVFNQLRETFSNIRIAEEDLLLKDADRVKAILDSNGMADNPLIRSLYRKAEDLGPAIPFEILTEDGDTVRGSVRRYDINFRYSKKSSSETLRRIKNFLESFGVGNVKELECDIDS